MNSSVCPGPGPTADPAESPAGNEPACAISSRVACSQSGLAPPPPAFRDLKEEKGPGLCPTPSSPWRRDSLNSSPLGTDVRRKGLQRCLPGRGEPDTLGSVLLPRPPPEMWIARFTITRWRPQACRPPHPL